MLAPRLCHGKMMRSGLLMRSDLLHFFQLPAPPDGNGQFDVSPSPGWLPPLLRPALPPPDRHPNLPESTHWIQKQYQTRDSTKGKLETPSTCRHML